MNLVVIDCLSGGPSLCHLFQVVHRAIVRTSLLGVELSTYKSQDGITIKAEFCLAQQCLRQFIDGEECPTTLSTGSSQVVSTKSDLIPFSFVCFLVLSHCVASIFLFDTILEEHDMFLPTCLQILSLSFGNIVISYQPHQNFEVNMLHLPVMSPKNLVYRADPLHRVFQTTICLVTLVFRRCNM